MKGIGCRNVEKYVHNHNTEVIKNVESQTESQLQIQHILGSNNENIGGRAIFTLSSEQVLYYSSQYFLAHNLTTLETTVIQRQGCFNHQVLYINRFRTQNKNSLILTIEKHNHHLYVGQLEIRGCVTEISKDNEEKQYSWKCSKLTNKHQFKIEDVNYHSTKQYLYLVTSLKQEDKTEKYLWVYDLKRECMIMSPLIKPSLSKSIINKIAVSEEPHEVMLMGSNYFRMWTISFNQKTLKQSNYRNIERALSNHQILKVFELHYGGLKHLAVLTQSTLLLLNNNQLVSVLTPPMKSLKEIKSKDNIEMELENSLNQIYRMKFLNEEEDCPKPDLTQTQAGLHQYDQFRCSSDVWLGQQGQSIVVATSTGNLLTYCVAGGQMKLVNHLVVRKNYAFDCILVSRKGQLIILSQNHCQNLYLVNKYSLNSEQKEEELKQFWGEGQIIKENIISMSSPAVHQRVCVLTEGNNFKMWSFRGRERRILFQTKFAEKVTEVTLHPCGLLVAVNFTNEIKLMSILPSGIYQVMSAKTNYNSVGLQYSTCGNYLVSNEQNLLIFYNPFTLKTVGYIEPPELKSKIVGFQITSQGNHIVFLTSDHSVYIQPLQLYNYSKYDSMVPAHQQSQPYTCFHYDSNITQALSNKYGQPENLFIGCSKSKYMAIYKNYGKELVVQFPVEGCHIVSLCVADGWLFAATSINSIRVYKWPIREQDCQLEVLSLEHKIVRLQQPSYRQYCFWSEDKPITKMHRLAFSNKLLVAREGGIMTVFKYHKYHLQKFQQIGQRKKLTQNLNSTYYITKNQSQKRNRMIQKTQGDILKIQNEIAKQKILLERKYCEQAQQHEKNFQEKIALQLHEKEEYLIKLQQNNIKMQEEIQLKRILFQEKKHRTHTLYKKKQNYEDGRNQHIRDDIQNTQIKHRQNIENKIRQHKQDIKKIKESYRNKVNNMKNQFEKMVTNEYPSLVSLTDTQIQRVNKINHSKRCSLRLQKQKSTDLALQFTLNDEQIIELNRKVQEINRSNHRLENQLEQLKQKVRRAEYQDESLQKYFQTYLQQYNSSRFTNLSLHSQVLKMRTQLLERKEVMEHKQDIINVAYQERQKLQNFKQLVKGSLTKIHDRKESINNSCIQKENQVALIFAQLKNNLAEYEDMKQKDKKLSALLDVYQKDKNKEQQRIDKAVNRLKQLKRYLLLQGLTEDQEQKELYVEQENLLTNINFYKKRMTMEALKEKKNKGLKKSSLNLVLKQNKNLLEEVNHLRQDTLGCEHEISNLGKKLGEANRMISIECKLKGQKTEVNEQRNQLEAIRALFNNEMASCQEVEQQEDIAPFDLD